ncbi:MAG: 6,7-dimethyl-8-ribityllumazine synthase [Betaproteobacteria bacterium RIFCSPLOWO2_12_FULL_63_13]|nr:MAG: 6,7-dimethyl-8-ribityllumazine synthase [Betaproteobacteria bacterium RIFCSPLOWO2_02_FULL_63_19]OGA42834.1 MAG: 6,7-dimethyl-8-ribityllumazine synthase [Betaproteobacteria bacterium RIFCSPLOWO2_12_FULL_63_13]
MNENSIDLDGNDLSIGIVRGRFNENIGLMMLDACLTRLAELGVSPSRVDSLSVPGALEVPLVLQKLAASGRYDALIALGAVIRGDTYHFEIVSNQSAAGISSVALQSGVPIANGILTTENDEQAEVRAPIKGRDCAEVAVEMANLLRAVARSHR